VYQHKLRDVDSECTCTLHIYIVLPICMSTRNLSKAHGTRESLWQFQFSSYSFENRISLGLGPSGP